MNWGCPTCPNPATLGDVVYDAGMLIALAARHPTPMVRAQHREFCRAGRPVVPAPVVAQAWRAGHSRANLARGLADCAVVCCYTEHEWRRIGEMIGRATLSAKKKPDPIDGLVASTASDISAAIIATSDPADLRAYLEQLPGTDAITLIAV